MVVNAQAAGKYLFKFLLRAGMAASLACILIGLIALIVSKPRKYAVLNILGAVFFCGMISFLTEGEPNIRYPGPPTYIPGPSH
jgi:hypothetical protein